MLDKGIRKRNIHLKFLEESIYEGSTTFKFDYILKLDYTQLFHPSELIREEVFYKNGGIISVIT